MHLTDALRRAAVRRPDTAALVFEQNRFTWSQFQDRVARLATVLRDLGVGNGDRVAMLANSSHRYIEYYYGSLWSGGIIVPLNSRHAVPEMIEQAKDAEPIVLIVDDAYASMAAAIKAGTPSLRHVIFAGDADGPPHMIDYEQALAGTSPCADAMRGGDDIACLFYTGGTTGRSKGVMLTHANLVANVKTTMALTGFNEALVHLHAGPLFHLAAGGRVLTTMAAGGRNIVLPHFRPDAVLAAITRERITTVTLVPTMIGMITQLENFHTYDLSSLNLITYGASPMPEALLRRAIEKFPGVRFAQAYGMTELSPLATYLGPEDHNLDGATHRLRSAGRAVPGVDVRVVDAADQTLPVGEVGEILVRGPNVMKGYWRQPSLTAEALRGGWMHTGDAGKFDADGYLYVVDRTKDMIISGGENVYSSEVETAIAQHPDVTQCAVIGIPDRKWGEAVHAVVVLRAGSRLNAEALIGHCRSLIAGYKCPRSVDLRHEPLPLSSVNKVDKVALRAPFWVGYERRVN
jgi:long-chain acyl-CoA synthetase